MWLNTLMYNIDIMIVQLIVLCCVISGVAY